MKAQEENRLTLALILITLDFLLWGLGVWRCSSSSVNMKVAQKRKLELPVSLLTFKQPPEFLK